MPKRRDPRIQLPWTDPDALVDTTWKELGRWLQDRRLGDRLATQHREEVIAIRSGSYKGKCRWRGCDEDAMEEHHVLDQAIFGALCEAFGTLGEIPVCRHHHRFITESFLAYYRQLFTREDAPETAQ